MPSKLTKATFFPSIFTLESSILGDSHECLVGGQKGTAKLPSAISGFDSSLWTA